MFEAIGTRCGWLGENMECLEHRGVRKRKDQQNELLIRFDGCRTVIKQGSEGKLLTIEKKIHIQ